MSDVTRSAAAQKLYEARRELEDLPAGEQQTRISVLLGELDALLPADEPRDRCADCDAIIPVPWFAANAIWNVVMPGTLKQRIVCAPCFMVRAESHFDRACWKLILEPKLSRTEDGTQPRSYYDVVRSMTADPDVLAAVDKAEAEDGTND